MQGPDLVVGIDVGMSCTGVAYLNRSRGQKKVKVFRDWGGDITESKVPTRLAYRDGRVQQWGFRCDTEDNVQVREWFKTSFSDPFLPQKEREAVHRLYLDYLTCLYERLKSFFSSGELHGTTWDGATIQFLFSIPANWNPKLSDELLAIIIQAGFKSGPRFTVEVAIKEPHAVASYTMANEAFIKNGETLLIVDAGGGTVDLCLLKVTDAVKNKVTLNEVAPRHDCGATFIDSDFEKLVKNRLTGFEQFLTTSLDRVAWLMKGSPFQPNKHDLGANDMKDNQTFRIKIPDAREHITAPSEGIENGQMIFTWSELKQLFDPQVAGIKRELDTMIEAYERRGEARPIDHIILSGGLGRSKYVFAQLKNHVENSGSQALRGTTVHHSTEPQLCVCHGIVDYAMQTINNNTKMFQRRISDDFLGIACRLRYKSMVLFSTDKKKLQDEAKTKGAIVDDTDGHRWIEGYMDWFVKRGAVIQNDEVIKYPYSFDFGPQVPRDNRTGWVRIKTCTSDPIPILDNDPRVRDNALLRVNLSRVSSRSIESRNRMGGMIGKKPYVRVHFYVTAQIGLADVSFKAIDFYTGNPLSEEVPVGMSITTEEEIPSSTLVNRE